MRAAIPFSLTFACVVGMGCGSSNGAKGRGAAGGPEHAIAARRQAPAPEPGSEMRLDNEVGVLDTGEVEATLQDHFDAVRACYERAGRAQRYAGGRVLLRFFVNGDGSARDVWVLESTLGNYDVERCLVEVGRRIQFEEPIGHKATTFEYPVEFRPTTATPVLDVDGLKLSHDVASLLPQLAACGQLAGEAVNAIIYIESNGFPGSVGLAAAAALDEDAGDCVVQTIRHRKMSIALPGRIVRVNFNIPPVVATAEATRHLLAHHHRR